MSCRYGEKMQWQCVRIQLMCTIIFMEIEVVMLPSFIDVLFQTMGRRLLGLQCNTSLHQLVLYLHPTT